MEEKDQDSRADTGTDSSHQAAVARAAVVGGLIGFAAFAALLAGLYFGLGVATRFPQTGPPPTVYFVLALTLITSVGGGAVLGAKIALSRSRQPPRP